MHLLLARVPSVWLSRGRDNRCLIGPLSVVQSLSVVDETFTSLMLTGRPVAVEAPAAATDRLLTQDPPPKVTGWMLVNSTRNFFSPGFGFLWDHRLDGRLAGPSRLTAAV